MHVWETITLENVAYIMNRPDLTDFEPLKFYVLRGNDTLYGHLPIKIAKKSSTKANSSR